MYLKKETEMSELTTNRKTAVNTLLAKAVVIQKERAMSRSSVERIRTALLELAMQREFWNETDYPAPAGDERQNRFLIGQGESGVSLYLNVLCPGKRIPPHNHTTWACIAGVEGVEENTFFDRVDDGSVPGRAEITTREVVVVGPGTGIAMLGEDIHSVEIKGSQTIRHLHFYGRPLETLDQRIFFDQEAGTYQLMEMSTKTKTP
jgi:predicted metal-dependent enzyme (double-stranded beta helix superfamily)|tara:strand:- start:166 stop:780 length:615 start_codon:yes stop_codon:yes gene_type:complete